MSPVTVSEFRDQNSGDELQKQVLTLVDLCGVIAEETPLSTDHTLKTFYQIIIRRAQSCPLGMLQSAMRHSANSCSRRREGPIRAAQVDVRSPSWFVRWRLDNGDVGAYPRPSGSGSARSRGTHPCGSPRTRLRPMPLCHLTHYHQFRTTQLSGTALTKPRKTPFSTNCCNLSSGTSETYTWRCASNSNWKRHWVTPVAHAKERLLSTCFRRRLSHENLHLSAPVFRYRRPRS